MAAKRNKNSPRTEATLKRKRDARRQSRQSISPSQSPSKRGRDAQNAASPTGKAEISADRTLRVPGEPETPELAVSPPTTPLSKANLATKVEDAKEVYTLRVGDPPKLNHHPESSGTNPSEERSNFSAVLSRPAVVHILSDTPKADRVKAKKKVARPSHGLVLHIPAVSSSWSVRIDDTGNLVATPSPISKGSPSPSKSSGVRTPAKSPRKLTFGVGLGSSSSGGILGELPFFMDSPSRRYGDARLEQALASSPTLGSMGPPDSSPTFGARSSNSFGTPRSPTEDRFGSPSADLGVRRRTDSQLLDSSPSACAITHAIDHRDSERNGTSWVRTGDPVKGPRAALGTLFEKPATRFLGSASGGESKRLASPERKWVMEGFDGKADPAASVPVSMDDFLKSFEKGSPGKEETSGSSRNNGRGTPRPAGDGGLGIQPGDGSPKLPARRVVPLAPLDSRPPQPRHPGFDEEESDLEFSDKENM